MLNEGALDIFTSHLQESRTKNLMQLIQEQNEKDEQYRRKLLPSGVEIHQLLQDSFEVSNPCIILCICDSWCVLLYMFLNLLG